MIEHGVPILFALFLWWFATGAIVYLDGLPKRTFSATFFGGSVLLAIAFIGLLETAGHNTVGAAYGAFASGLVIWAWLELAFYTGFITGPRRTPCPPDSTGAARFWMAVDTVSWNLLASLIAAAFIAAVVWDQPNKIALWTFLVLWWMQQSAKLNVFLGVRNLNEEFLPAHLDYLRSFMRKRPINLFFPVSVTLSTVVCVMIVMLAHDPAISVGQATGLALVATMLGLAILEHWFLVLPIPAERLWSWSLVTHAKPHLRADDAPDRHHATVISELSGTCDRSALQTLLSSVAAGEFGEIEQLHGIARDNGSWVQFDVSHGAVRIDAIEPNQPPRCEATVTGLAPDLERLRAAFARCVQRPTVKPAGQPIS